MEHKNKHFWYSHLKVTFDENVNVYEYKKKEEEKEVTFFDRESFRTTPRPSSLIHYMVSVENLLKDVCPRQPVTIVYGNLGRYPSILSYYLDCLYHYEEKVAVCVGGMNLNCYNYHHPDKPSKSYSPLEEDYPDDGREVNLLYWIEPEFGAKLDRFPHRISKYLIILSSHLNLEITKSVHSNVVAYHLGDILTTRFRPPFIRYVSISEAKSEQEEETLEHFIPDIYYGRYVQVGWSGAPEARADLSHCESTSEAYLRLLCAQDTIDYACKPHSIRYWSAILKSDIQHKLMTELIELKRNLLEKRGKIQCNLNGIDVMVAENIDPFLCCCISQ